jgi:hypothetical protein
MSINNEILNCIHERRSTRRFTEKQISSGENLGSGLTYGKIELLFS